MQDIFTMLSQLRRPRLLISAARHGAKDYDRNRHLKRVLDIETVPAAGPAAMRLMEIERGMNDARKTGDATYEATRHIEVLIALMGEANLLRPTHP